MATQKPKTKQLRRARRAVTQPPKKKAVVVAIHNPSDSADELLMSAHAKLSIFLGGSNVDEEQFDSLSSCLDDLERAMELV